MGLGSTRRPGIQSRPSATPLTPGSTGSTAPAYGLGRSERIVGQALQGLATRRMYCEVFAGVGRGDTGTTNNLSPASIRREVEDSLRRLRIDAIDLYQIHWPIRTRISKRAGNSGGLQRAVKSVTLACRIST